QLLVMYLLIIRPLLSALFPYTTLFRSAPDLVEQLSVSYHYSGASYTNVVNETVVAVGYNDNFIIVKQRPIDIDTTVYYIIDINKDRKSTRLNSSHVKISYAVFCLKKKN